MLEECSGGILLTESRRACEHGMRFLPLSLPSCLLSSFPALITFYRPSSLPFLVPPLSDYVRRYASVALFLDEEDKAGRSEREREAGRPTQSSPAPSAGVPRQHPHRGRQPSLSSSVVGGVGGGNKGEDVLGFGGVVGETNRKIASRRTR